MLSAKFQRVESFNHHRINVYNKDSHEQRELVDSNELQETSATLIDTQSGKQVDSEETKIVKGDVLQSSSGHSSEEGGTSEVSPLENQSDEDKVNSKEIKLVKRDTRGHSSEEDVTTVGTISLADQSVEDDVVDSKEKMKVKRSLQDHSSEEEMVSAAIVRHISHSDEHEYDYSAELFKREIQQLTAEELEMLFQLFNSEEDKRADRIFIGHHSDEYDLFDSIEKRDTTQVTMTDSSEENSKERAFDHSIEDVLEQLALDAKLPSTSLRIQIK
jgi:hypothetical protein